MPDQHGRLVLRGVLDEYPCPKCGSFTYQFGNVLPGQGRYETSVCDNRIREHRACVSCDWKSTDD